MDRHRQRDKENRETTKHENSKSDKIAPPPPPKKKTKQKDARVQNMAKDRITEQRDGGKHNEKNLKHVTGITNRWTSHIKIHVPKHECDKTNEKYDNVKLNQHKNKLIRNIRLKT